MGSDRGVSFSSGRQHPTGRPKVFQNSEFLIGGTGHVRPIQVMEYGFVPPELTEGLDVYRYMVNNFSIAFRKALKTAGCLHQYHGYEWMDASFLVGFRKRTFFYSNDFTTVEYTEGYGAAGNGEEYALGSLRTTENLDFNPFERIALALEAASLFNYGVIPPFDIIGMEWTDKGVIYYNRKDINILIEEDWKNGNNSSE
jgi:hypothetical protein